MKNALIIIDVQNDYFETGATELVATKEASINARLILERFRNENRPVIHIQHISTRPNATYFLPGTTGAGIHKNVYPNSTEKIVVKHFPNSFRETELLEY